MISDRLEAWTRILLMDTDVSGIFITHIPAVLQELLDKTPTAEKLLALESIPTGTAMTAESAPWRQKLMSDFAHVVEHKWPSAKGRRLWGVFVPAAGRRRLASRRVLTEARGYASGSTTASSVGWWR